MKTMDVSHNVAHVEAEIGEVRVHLKTWIVIIVSRLLNEFTNKI